MNLGSQSKERGTLENLYGTLKSSILIARCALQVKEKRAELEKLKSTFVRRASEFLRNYFASLVDFMISDKSYFSQVFSLNSFQNRYF
jgi:hypothetical protein